MGTAIGRPRDDRRWTGFAGARAYLALIALWLVFFALLRLVFVALTFDLKGGATAADLTRAFLHGLRFDLATGVALVAPVAVIRLLVPRDRLGGAFWTAASAAATAGIALAEVPYFREFHHRLGALAVDYLVGGEELRTLLRLVRDDQPVVPWLLGSFSLGALFLVPARRTLRAFRFPVSIRARALSFLGLLALTAVAARGGVQRVPLGWGHSVFSESEYANALSENPVYDLVQALRYRWSGREAVRSWLGEIDPREAVTDLRSITVLPGEQLLDPSRDPLLRLSEASRPPWLQRRPRNVVLVLMESFGARFVGAIAGPPGLTPGFDELARHGVLFDRALSVGTHTHQAVFGTLCSFPNLPVHERLMKDPAGNRDLRCLPKLLREIGYETAFFYNGRLAYDNLGPFLRRQGMERLFSLPDFPPDAFHDPDWGVADGDTFDLALGRLSRIAAEGKPFLGVVLTLSNHAPFRLPTPPGLGALPARLAADPRHRGVHYADFALSGFVRAARSRDWFDDTLFVFVGDHGFSVSPVLTELGLLRMHVPLLWYGPKIVGEDGRVVHRVASQLDILPTILGLLGVRVAHSAFGRDLFRLADDDPGHAYVKRAGEPVVGFVEGRDVLALAPDGSRSLHRFDLGRVPSAGPDRSEEDRDRAATLSRHLRALVATGLRVLAGSARGGAARGKADAGTGDAAPGPHRTGPAEG